MSADPGALIALFDDYFFYQAGPAGEWYTAVAVTIRNESGSPLTIEAVAFDEVHGLKVGAPAVVGPQSPSISMRILSGDPPKPLPGILTDPLDIRPLRGYIVRPEIAGKVSPPYGDDREVADEENDASIVVPILRPVDDEIGYVRGVSVEYTTGDGRPLIARFPGIEFGMCSTTEFAENQCKP